MHSLGGSEGGSYLSGGGSSSGGSNTTTSTGTQGSSQRDIQARIEQVTQLEERVD